MLFLFKPKCLGSLGQSDCLWYRKVFDIAELLGAYMILLKCLLISILLHRVRLDNIRFSVHGCNSVCGLRKIRMSLEKPSVYKKHKREGNPKGSQIRCISHSNIKLQRLSCLNWLHKFNSWQNCLCASCWNKAKSEWIPNISMHLDRGRKGCWRRKSVKKDARRQRCENHSLVLRTNSKGCHKEK